MPYFIENVIADSVFAKSVVRYRSYSLRLSMCSLKNATDPEVLTYTIDPFALHGSLSSCLTIGAAS